ncbi:MAG TPA: SPOR domain-containing protein [Candidatus Acidoferrales bacterium]|nr:SPOR domain-containing protein [Candidatus Acidoferrales bacterium]
MATNGKRGGDRVLESRHLIGLFLGVVLLCGVFFTLGYVMGRTQYGGAVHAETIARRSVTASAPVAADTSKNTSAAAPAPSEWDFYPKRDSAKKNDVISAKPEPTAALQTVAENPAPEPSATPPEPVVFSTKTHTAPPASPTHVAKASIVLQVAALRHESDAVEMSRLLRKKHFPSFVSSPLRGETLYRVQVGPYADEHAADTAKAALDRAGFKAIIKH